MVWVKGVIGVICLLIGLLWIGQGLNLVPGSFMSGQIQYALLGLLLVVVGGWLLWTLARRRNPELTDS
jgi:hypothetical protein